MSQCDQVMEFSWSALWNITDETPDNCQMFLNCRGMSLFLECLQVSPHLSLIGYVLSQWRCGAASRPDLLCRLCRSSRTNRSCTATCWASWETWLRSKL